MTEHTQQPSVGRSVHYQSYGTPGGEYLPKPRAAVITQVHLDDDGRTCPSDAVGAPPEVPCVGLAVLNPTGLFFDVHVPYSETPKPGHWNWPPRVGQ